jgi:hypothetical protein
MDMQSLAENEYQLNGLMSVRAKSRTNDDISTSLDVTKYKLD